MKKVIKLFNNYEGWREISKNLRGEQKKKVGNHQLSITI